ncbi:restriction endonuclease [Duganella sp. LjRoot269]|uniref:nSTAND3 domain-containing NTPase n=1 Tax=Duganella sp. LjRoot269 TaxID=3342305 RepID=UPI003ECEEE78
MSNPTFDLHKLGWKAFEDLIACVLKEVLGQTYQVFSCGPDGGRDGAFFGTWLSDTAPEPMSGSFTIQCKHTSKPGSGLTKAVIKDEIAKVRRLCEHGLADNYLLFTNHDIGGPSTETLEAEFRRAGAKNTKIFGAKWIDAAIASHPTLRRLVPRLYGLGDLTQIITHQAYRQAKQVLDSIAPDLACFVPTDAYRKCAHALKEHGFVMLIGEPACGKTMIANLLALSAADEWGLQTLILNGPEDFDRKWNPDDPGQFFWVDDAFGSNHCDFNRVNEWNQRLPQLKAAIHQNARVIFTSRTYIFKAAQSRFNSHKFDLLTDNRVTIEVEKLSESERALILYNHLKLGTQNVAFRQAVKSFLPAASATPKFLPEIARRFSNPKFTKGMVRNEAGILDFFSNPTTVMVDIVAGLGNAERAALALVFTNGGSLSVPLAADDEDISNIIAAMQSNIGDVKAALVSLDDSLLRKAIVDGVMCWQFRHPTIRDAFATNVSNNPELIDIYLSGVKEEKLIQEISCGDLGIEGVKLVVPESLYGRVLEILHPLKEKYLSSPVLAFLGSRCDPYFLSLWFSGNDEKENLFEQIYGTSQHTPVLSIFGKLNIAGFLSNEMRLRIAKRLRNLADLDYSDCFIDEDFVGVLLTSEENEASLVNQKDVLYSSVDDSLDEVEKAWQVHDDVDDAFYDIRRLIERIQELNEERYGQESYQEGESERAQKILDKIDTRIKLMKKRQAEAPAYEELATEDTPLSILSGGRSIFDDVDE